LEPEELRGEETLVLDYDELDLSEEQSSPASDLNPSLIVRVLLLTGSLLLDL